MNPHIEALEKAKLEMGRWNTKDSPSVTGHVLEEIALGHELHSAIEVLEGFYGGALPRPALVYWRKLLRATRDGGTDEDEDEAEEQLEKLLSWVERELLRLNEIRRRKPAGRPEADSATQQKETAIWEEWQIAKSNGVYKGDFAEDKSMSLKDLQRLLDRVAARNRRSDK